MDRLLPIQLIIPAEHQHLTAVSDALQGLFEGDSVLSNYKNDLYNIQLGVHELCTNIVDHAYAEVEDGNIFIVFEVSEDPVSLSVSVTDTGKGFNEEEVPEPEFGTLQVRGWGLFLVHQLMDEVTYNSRDGKNTWLVTKNFSVAREVSE